MKDCVLGVIHSHTSKLMTNKKRRQLMPKYEVLWVKRYYATGTVEVEAPNGDDAHDMVMDKMGDYTGSMQYEADGDEVEVMKEII